MSIARRIVAASVLALPFVAAIPALADVEVPTLHRLATVDTSDIVVARVVSIAAVNAGTRGVDTHVALDILHVVDGALSVGQRITLAQLGGQTADRSLQVSDQPLWSAGDTYLLCLGHRPDGLFTLPFSREGQFHVVTGHDGVLYALGFGERPVRRISNGQLLYAPRALDILEGQARVDREPYLAVDPVDLTPGGAGRTWPTQLGDWADAMTLDQFVGALASARGTAVRPAGHLDGVAIIAGISSAGLPMCGCGYQLINEVFWQVPASFSCYAPNEWMMAQFNYYLDFVRYHAGTGYWDWGNGADDLTGFPSNADLASQFGSGTAWTAGGRGLTIYYYSSGDCTSIVEADIMCNPSKIFVYDFESSFGTTDHWHYEKTMIHEMGHALGLFAGSYCGTETYQFNRPTIMFNNQTYQVEYAWGIHRADFNTLKQLYSSQLAPKDVYDMGIESYYADGPIINATATPSVVASNGSLTVSNFYVENICKKIVPGVRVRVYLSTNRTISTGDYQLGADIDFGDFCVNCDWLGSVTRSLPASIPAGNYYVGLMVSRGGDAHIVDEGVNANNTTWVATPVTVRLPFTGWSPPGDVLPVHFILSRLLSADLWIDTNGAGDDASPPTCGGTTMGPSIFYSFVAPETGVLSIGPSGSQGPTTDLLVNGWMVAAYQGSATSGSTGQFLGVQCGDFVQALSPLTMNVTAGQTYVLRFGSAGPGAIASSFGASIAPARPYGSAPELPLPWSATIALSNTNMPLNALALPCASSSTRGFWMSWRAPANGILMVDTCRPETNFRNTVSIHPLASPSTVMGCGLGGGMTSCASGFGAQASSVVTGGQDYLIRVGSISTQGGAFALNLSFSGSPVDNATCDRAILASAGSVQSFATDGGSADPVALCSGATSVTRACWYKFYAAAAPGRLRATTCPDLGGDAAGPSSVSAFATCPSATAGAQPIACDNDPCDGVTTGVQVSMMPGQSVFVRVSAAESAVATSALSGHLAFLFQATCQGDLTNDRTIDGADLGVLLSKWGAYIPSGSLEAYIDLNGDSIVNGADLGVLLSKWGACP